MTLARGARLGPYEVLGPLGAGGMGEVYKAQDTRLGREVAIKVLPEQLASDPERLKRFEKEARAASALSHPNIVTIYDIGREASVFYLAMEFVAGSTLRELLSEGPLPVKRALSISADVAQGLARAHAAGIVHRDLKPENVMVGSDGLVKILDFGLAKQTRPGSDGGQGTRVPTESLSTEAGVVMGTVGYMSPEQASGHPMDFRTDQFSLGAVMYEMLTGRRAFAGASAPQTLAAIIELEPEPIASVNSRVPPPVNWIVERSLAKDPKSRYASTEDLARDLATVRDRFSELGGAGEYGRAMSPIARRAGSKGLGLAAVALAAAAAALLTWPLWHRKSPDPRAVARFSIDLPPRNSLSGNLDNDLAISPDGTKLAWARLSEDGDTVIQLRRLDELHATPLVGTKGARMPFFSPDGESLGFFSGGKLRKISPAGGTSVTLCDVEDPAGATWGADGQIYFGQERSAIWRVPAGGGVAQAFTTLAKDELAHTLPETLPGSEALVFIVVKATDFEIAVLEPGSRAKRMLMKNSWGARYAAGRLIFERQEGSSGALFAAPFDVGELQWKGDPVPVMEGISLVRKSEGHNFALSRNGTLFYDKSQPWVGNGVLVRVDRRGTEKRLTEVPRAFGVPRLSPDGKRLAVSIGPDPLKSDVWIFEGERETLTRLTHTEDSANPVWTSDGKRLCFDRVVMKSRFNIFCQKSDGSAEAEPLLKSPVSQWPASFSPDGAWLSFSEGHSQTQGDMWLFPLTGGGQPKLLLGTPYNEWGAFFSPDGRWLAYTGDESGRSEIYVLAFPGPSGRWQVSTDGGTEPVWSRDGRELFYRQEGKVMSVAIGHLAAFKAGTPRVLFEWKYPTALGATSGWASYCVADGDGFFMVKPVDNSGLGHERLEVVLNWIDEITRQRSAASPR